MIKIHLYCCFFKLFCVLIFNIITYLAFNHSLLLCLNWEMLNGVGYAHYIVKIKKDVALKFVNSPFFGIFRERFQADCHVGVVRLEAPRSVFTPDDYSSEDDLTTRFTQWEIGSCQSRHMIFLSGRSLPCCRWTVTVHISVFSPFFFWATYSRLRSSKLILDLGKKKTVSRQGRLSSPSGCFWSYHTCGFLRQNRWEVLEVLEWNLANSNIRWYMIKSC